MKSLLIAIQSRLRDRLESLRDADIYITPDVDLIPTAAGRPCVGLKDGSISKEERVGDVIATELTVTIVVYVTIHKNEASVIGDTASKTPGVLELCADIDDALDEWHPDSAYIRAWSDGSRQSETVADGSRAAARKIIPCVFLRQEDR